MTINTALISVSDKSGIVEFAAALSNLGIKILSTGGTARLLAAENISVVEVSDHTGFTEIMDGRVKTLHPTIHGGILGRRGQDDEVMEQNGITAIDLVVVNLYPFEKTIANPNVKLEDAIENIDIGGPAMVRAAAKNYEHVAVVVDSDDYPVLLQSLSTNDRNVDDALRFKLSTKAFSHTASYDGKVAAYLALQLQEERHKEGSQEAGRGHFPGTLDIRLEKQQEMRYGENPHQSAAFYREVDDSLDQNISSVTNAVQLQGKALSYNNIADTDAALECVKQFGDEPSCVIVKHGNPCGVATAPTLIGAYEKAFGTDPESAFGGIIAINKKLDGATAKLILNNQFVEVIIAPEVSTEATEILRTKENVRVLSCGPLLCGENSLDYKRVAGGFLVQDADSSLVDGISVVTHRKPTEQEMENLMFAWKVAKFVKSNAIIYANNRRTIGVGAGQMSRVNSARIAAIKAEHAGLSVSGCVMASDAFFPFKDGLESAGQAGVTAVIQPGGSLRDAEVIEAANKFDIAMVFTGMRHFRH